LSVDLQAGYVAFLFIVQCYDDLAATKNNDLFSVPFWGTSCCASTVPENEKAKIQARKKIKIFCCFYP
jgi:hypothetical protein